MAMSDVTETDKKPLPAGMKPWTKGQSGNPAGKPKGARNRQTIVREMLEALVDERDEDGNKTGRQIPAVEAMTRAQLIKAITGDTNAFKEMMDSGYGKLTEKVETAHTFTQMGRTVVTPDRPVGAPVEQQPAAKELTFDVGSPLPVIDGECEVIEEGQGDGQQQD